MKSKLILLAAVILAGIGTTLALETAAPAPTADKERKDARKNVSGETWTIHY